MTFFKNKAPWVGVVLIFVVGTGLRFSALERQSLWDDEMSSLHDVRLPLQEWPERFRTYEMHPPLFFLQLKVWNAVLGGHASLGQLRSLSAFWGSASLVFFYLLTRRYLGSAGGLWAMGMLAASPQHLGYSQELRPYALAIAMGILSLLILEYMLQPPRKHWFIALGLVWLAQLYTHYWGSFVVLAQGVYGLIAAKDASLRKRLWWTLGVVCALFSAWLPFLWKQMHTDPIFFFWFFPASPMSLVRTFVVYTGLYVPFASRIFTEHVPLLLAALTGLLYGVALARGIQKGPKAALVWLVIGLGVPYVISYFKPSLYLWYRYPLLIYPAFLLLVVSGALHFKQDSSIGKALLLGLIAMSLWGTVIYFTRWQKANPKEVVAYVDALENESTVVVRPHYFSELFSFYDRGAAPVIDQHTLDSVQKRAQLKTKKVVLVAFDELKDPVSEALLNEYQTVSRRYFSGFGRLGITVYELKGRS